LWTANAATPPGHICSRAAYKRKSKGKQGQDGSGEMDEEGKGKRERGRERYNREGGKFTKLVSRQDWGNDEKLKLEKGWKKKGERKKKGNKAGKTKKGNSMKDREKVRQGEWEAKDTSLFRQPRLRNFYRFFLYTSYKAWILCLLTANNISFKIKSIVKCRKKNNAIPIET
jgi:hypothetical protein